MNDGSPPASAVAQAARGLAEVVAEFADELGGPPTLAEFLEFVGWAIPVNSEATDGMFAEPLRFTAVLKGNKPYRGDAASRVPELADHLFEDARDHHRELVDRLRATGDAPVTPQRFAAAILEILRSGRIILADAEPDEIRKLTPDVAKKRVTKPKPGDVLAIPARDGGYHLAVVITRNRFGIAVGLFRGVSPRGRLDAGLRAAPRKFPVYTDGGMIADGTWKIVDHDESLLAPFPPDPPIYHRPNAWPGRVDTGEFGAAETADGNLRMIEPQEAREVGIADGTYRPVCHAALLQKRLDEGAV